ncbi:MAG TPA: hypothetical protein VMS55_28065 [Myxococcota bacterium]|nr:hypothetical protein [Myxococcota bacterium]
MFLLVGGASEWTLPLAVILSSCVVHIQTMWRQAPITAAIVIAAGLTTHSRVSGLEQGLRKVAEVHFGCVVGLLVNRLISKLWPVAAPAAA